VLRRLAGRALHRGDPVSTPIGAPVLRRSVGARADATSGRALAGALPFPDDAFDLVEVLKDSDGLTVGQLVERRDAAGHMTVAFGAPERGLPAIFGLDPDDAVSDGGGDDDAGFDLWLNTVPNQGSEVVRTEEAMFAALGCLTLTE
jgi:hypothetical protein